jgi:hypothetical protein
MNTKSAVRVIVNAFPEGASVSASVWESYRNTHTSPQAVRPILMFCRSAFLDLSRPSL